MRSRSRSRSPARSRSPNRPQTLQPEEMDEAQKRLDMKLRSLQTRIDQLSTQFDLEKPSEEFFEQVQKEDYSIFVGNASQ